MTSSSQEDLLHEATLGGGIKQSGVRRTGYVVLADITDGFARAVQPQHVNPTSSSFRGHSRRPLSCRMLQFITRASTISKARFVRLNLDTGSDLRARLQPASQARIYARLGSSFPSGRSQRLIGAVSRTPPRVVRVQVEGHDAGTSLAWRAPS